MKMVNLLRSYQIIPVLVFDGGNLPSKKGTEASRREYVPIGFFSSYLPFISILTLFYTQTHSSSKRKEAREKGMELLKAGDKKAAMECFQRAVDVTPRMAFNLIELLRKENVEFVVAPFEADPQLTYLCLNGIVDAVISEDSDLIPYGCPRMIYKLDKDGNGKEIQFRDLGLVKDLDLSRFSAEMFRHMCILSGCDYLESLPGMGLKKAHSLLLKHGTMGEIFKAIEASKTTLPEGYALDFGRADLTFQHQIVYDPRSGRTVHLHPLPDDVDPSTLPFTGEHLDDTVAQLIADGRIDPHTYEPFILSIPTSIPNSNAVYQSPSVAAQASHSNAYSRNSSQAQGRSLADSTQIVSGGTQPLSQTSAASTPTRLSMQWQSRNTTPLSALKQSFGNSSASPRQAAVLSATEISKHDNDMTRDVQRYTMFRGSGKGVRNAATTASTIISSSTSPVSLKPTNTLHSYFNAAPSPSPSKSPYSTNNNNSQMPTSPYSLTKNSSSLPASTSGTILRSRFFASSAPSAPSPSAAYSPNTTPNTTPNGTVDLSAFGALLDDEFEELDEATEALLAQAELSRPPSTQKKVPTHSAAPTPSSSTTTAKVFTPAPSIASPSRITIPSKIISISLEDEEEFELVPMQLENKLNARTSFSLVPITSAPKPATPPLSPKTMALLETTVVESVEAFSGRDSLAISSSSLVLSSSVNLAPSLFDQLQSTSPVPTVSRQANGAASTISSSSSPSPPSHARLSSPPSNSKKRGREDFEITTSTHSGSPPTKIKVDFASEINIFNLLE